MHAYHPLQTPKTTKDLATQASTNKGKTTKAESKKKLKNFSELQKATAAIRRYIELRQVSHGKPLGIITKSEVTKKLKVDERQRSPTRNQVSQGVDQSKKIAVGGVKIIESNHYI